jgi:hypothetical protein
MKLEKAENRDRKKNKNRMIVTGRGAFLLQEQIVKRGEKAKAKAKKKNKRIKDSSDE